MFLKNLWPPILLHGVLFFAVASSGSASKTVTALRIGTASSPPCHQLTARVSSSGFRSATCCVSSVHRHLPYHVCARDCVSASSLHRLHPYQRLVGTTASSSVSCAIPYRIVRFLGTARSYVRLLRPLLQRWHRQTYVQSQRSSYPRDVSLDFPRKFHPRYLNSPIGIIQRK